MNQKHVPTFQIHRTKRTSSIVTNRVLLVSRELQIFHNFSCVFIVTRNIGKPLFAKIS